MISNSNYARNFKDSYSKNNEEPVSYKPSLGKLFSDAANVRFRIDYSKSVDGNINLPHQCKRNRREIIAEKDIIDRNVNDKSYNFCLFEITSKGIEDIK